MRLIAFLNRFKTCILSFLQQVMPRLPVRFYGILVFVCTYVIVHSFQDNGRTISFIPNGYDFKGEYR